VARLEAAAETTNQLWDVQKDMQQRSKDVYFDKLTPPDGAQPEISRMATKPKAKITTSLGAQGISKPIDSTAANCGCSNC